VFSVIILSSCGSKNTGKVNISEEDSDQQANEQPNILWIVADDLGLDIGCYGEQAVNTPNMDLLASEGMRFNKLYTVAAVCSVSRSALITGMYPVSINSHQHRTRFKDSLPYQVKPITDYFKAAGYFVTNKGKTDYNFIHSKKDMYDGTDWNQRKEGQPFFSQIQISFPHRPFKRDATNPVNPKEVKVLPYYTDHPIVRQDWALYLETVQDVDKQVGEIMKRLAQEGLSENTIVFFFGDQGRPHVRAKQFLYEGGIRTPLIIRWPGKITPGSVNDRLVSNVDIGPSTMKAVNLKPPNYLHGKDFLSSDSSQRKYVFAMRDRRDETVDRIRMVRNERYKYIRNFYPDRPYTQFNAYKKHSYPVLTLMKVMYKKGELTPDQARFMRKERPFEELYDLKNDPHEMENLIQLESHIKEAETLRNILNDWLSKFDLGQYPENPEEILHAQKLMMDIYEKQMKLKGLESDISDEEFLKYWEEYLDQQKPFYN
jgi:uncharacterized sulfatase